MSERKSGRGKKGRSVVARCVVFCIVAAIIGTLAIPGLAAEQTSGTVTVTVNAPEMAKVGESFEASIDVDNLTDFNSGKFDLSFDSGVVSVTGVVDGNLDSETIPVDRWEFMDENTIRVILEIRGITGVSGSGYLAKISFEVVGEKGDKTMLNISEGMLVDKEAEDIPAEWIDGEVIVGPIPVTVEVNAPGMVKAGETFDASIDVDSIIDFNTGKFDMSFDSTVVNVTDVADGRIDGTAVPVDRWEFMNKDTIRIILDVSGISGVSGSGYLAKISFEVVGKGGDRSVLDISEGMLVDKEAEEITAQWIDDEIIVGPIPVRVNAQGMVKAGEIFNATIDVDNVMDFNSGKFDLSFDSSVVNVTAVVDGRIDGRTIQVEWGFLNKDKIRVIIEFPGIAGISGSGYLAKVSFEVVGEGGDRSVLDISEGMLVDTEVEEIPAKWVDDEVIVGPIPVRVNAPERVKAGETFNATIDVDNVIDFNLGQFDLSFDSSVVNVTGVANGSLGGTTVPVDEWEFVDKNTIRAILEFPGITGVSGSGNLATVSFAVVGETGDKSILGISEGMLVNTEAEEIPAKWIDDMAAVGPIQVRVNAPERVKAGETFNTTIDVDNVIDFNLGQFDLSFDSSVVNVTDIADGSLDGTTVPVDEWEFVDKNTIRAILEFPGITCVSGSGYLVKISFEVKGEEGDESILDISNGTLYNNKVVEIPTEWIDDEVSVL